LGVEINKRINREESKSPNKWWVCGHWTATASFESAKKQGIS